MKWPLHCLVVFCLVCFLFVNNGQSEKRKRANRIKNTAEKEGVESKLGDEHGKNMKITNGGNNSVVLDKRGKARKKFNRAKKWKKNNKNNNNKNDGENEDELLKAYFDSVINDYDLGELNADIKSLAQSFSHGYTKLTNYFDSTGRIGASGQLDRSFRMGVFIKNQQTYQHIKKDPSRHFEVDDESMFLLVTDEEKNFFRGLRNLTELEYEDLEDFGEPELPLNFNIKTRLNERLHRDKNESIGNNFTEDELIDFDMREGNSYLKAFNFFD